MTLKLPPFAVGDIVRLREGVAPLWLPVGVQQLLTMNRRPDFESSMDHVDVRRQILADAAIEDGPDVGMVLEIVTSTSLGTPVNTQHSRCTVAVLVSGERLVAHDAEDLEVVALHVRSDQQAASGAEPSGHDPRDIALGVLLRNVREFTTSTFECTCIPQKFTICWKCLLRIRVAEYDSVCEHVAKYGGG